MSLVGFLKEFSEAEEDIKEENERRKKSMETAKKQSKKRGRR